MDTETGRARFGSGTIGVGEKFAIAILATDAFLPEGVLSRLPERSKLSRQIVVNRSRKE